MLPQLMPSCRACCDSRAVVCSSCRLYTAILAAFGQIIHYTAVQIHRATSGAVYASVAPQKRASTLP